jgi:hypothetical protein
VFLLDCCLFTPNMTTGIIAHTLDDVRKIFRRKIKHPFDRLPDQLRLAMQPTNDTLNELIFPNKSEISVDTNVRGGTYNYLLISEYATIAHQFPEKAAEIKTGSFNTVHPGNFLFVESTGKGKGGEFYELIQAARKASVRDLTKLEFKYHFYPWWMNRKYRLDPEEAKKVVFTRAHMDYFAKTEKTLTAKAELLLARGGKMPSYLDMWLKTGMRFTIEQRAWYVVKKELNGDEMKREYPSTEEEPFEAVLKGAIFAEKMQEAREAGRITKVPHEPALGVHTWWDIGRRDMTAIWFVQTLGREVRFIKFHQEGFKELPYYLSLLSKWRVDLKYHYGQHLGPHDMGVVEFTAEQAMTRAARAAQLGYQFHVGQQWEQKDQIDAGRNLLSMCWFDEAECAEGIAALEQFRREWSEHLQQYMDTYRHDENSHAASAYMLGAMMMGYLNRGRPKAHPVGNVRFAT